jgi:hypothetical protein
VPEEVLQWQLDQEVKILLLPMHVEHFLLVVVEHLLTHLTFVDQVVKVDPVLQAHLETMPLEVMEIMEDILL